MEAEKKIICGNLCASRLRIKQNRQPRLAILGVTGKSRVCAIHHGQAAPPPDRHSRPCINIENVELNLDMALFYHNFFQTHHLFTQILADRIRQLATASARAWKWESR
jgi:hypothetical protein